MTWKQGRKRKVCAKHYHILATILLVCMSFYGRYQVGTAQESLKVKVGYPPVMGFTEVSDGTYRGYAYEYLAEIAKYTGWEYEFIEMDLNDLIYQLADGSIDLAAGMLKNEVTEQMYDFPEENAGYTYATLAMLKENETSYSYTYESLNGARVGYFETSKTLKQSLEEFCNMYQIEGLQLISYPYDERFGEEVLLQALRNGEVDLILTKDLLLQQEEKIVAKFAPTPYYFATTKGNHEIQMGLNYALTKIKENNVNFDQQLYMKYFQNSHDYKVHLTKEEQVFIDGMKPLKVVYVDHFAPMQYYDEKKKEPAGVYVDVMKLIADKSGLKYEFVRADSHDEAFLMMKNKQADLFVSAPDDYIRAESYGYTQSQEFFEVSMVKVMNLSQEPREEKEIIALPSGYNFLELKGDYEIHYYKDIEECLIAVNEGKANCTYGNSYTISRYVSSGRYSNLTIIFNEKSIRAGIGIAKPTNLMLLSIINKCVASISDNEISAIIYKNTYDLRAPIALKDFLYDNIQFCIAVLMVVVLMVVIILSLWFRSMRNDRNRLLIKSQSDALTNVYNRAAGIELVKNHLNSMEKEECCALVIIDIDHFKQVNDQLGHLTGDRLLMEFGQLLTQFFHREDIIFRLGGDEFIVFIKSLDEEAQSTMKDRLEDLRDLMHREIEGNGKKQTISLSMGAIVSTGIQSFDWLYHEADELLYKVKEAGRNGYQLEVLHGGTYESKNNQ